MPSLSRLSRNHRLPRGNFGNDRQNVLPCGQERLHNAHWLSHKRDAGWKGVRAVHKVNLLHSQAKAKPCWVGINVNLASRIQSVATPDQVVVSDVLKSLAFGSGLTFEELGDYELKGFDGKWKLSEVR